MNSKLMNSFYRLNLMLNRIPILIAIRKGLTYMMPLVLLGSFALLILSFPISAYQTLMQSAFWGGLRSMLTFVRDGTFNVLSPLTNLCISYAYISEVNQGKNNISPILGICASFASYIAISGISSEGFLISNFAASGISIAILVAVISSYLFVRLSAVSFLKIRAFTNGVNAAFSYALASIFPVAITVTIFAVFNSILVSVFHITNIQFFIQTVFSKAFLEIKSQFASGILFVFAVHILWFLGLHGSNILEPVTLSVFSPGTDINHANLVAGLVPNAIFTKTFFDSFVLMGGCGATFCLIITLLIAGKHKNQKGLARLSFLPILFNINELIVFGLPIVLNPIFVIPFIGIPILLTITSYLAMYWGLVPYTVHTVEWTTPIFLSGYASTGSISGSLLQLFNLALGVACYLPFVKLAERVSLDQLKENLQRVYGAFKQDEERGYPPSLLGRHDEIGNIARFLAADLNDDMKNNKIMLFYQPKTDYTGNIFGVEALLRWNHESYGFVYPPLIIALAEESQLVDSLGNWILDKACSDMKALYTELHKELTFSVNVSAVQLDNDEFVSVLKNTLSRYDIPGQLLEIEITEQVALTGSRKIMDQIDAIRKLGVRLAMDDFGMGHSSMKYLKEYDFDTIKLDGSLVREVASNTNCQNIISSIVYLSKSLNCSVVAEYVEDEIQQETLYNLGCEKYQGYLYSRPLSYEDLVHYLKNRKISESKYGNPAAFDDHELVDRQGLSNPDDVIVIER